MITLLDQVSLNTQQEVFNPAFIYISFLQIFQVFKICFKYVELFPTQVDYFGKSNTLNIINNKIILKLLFYFELCL